jgi:cytidylate kinase
VPSITLVMYLNPHVDSMKLKKNIVSFNGDHGSGKSTIAKKIAVEFDYDRFYMGKIFRDMARDEGISYTEFLELLKKDSSYDKKVDDYVVELSKEKNNFVIESRTAWYFIPDSFKIYLKVSEEEGAKRMFKDYLKNEHRKIEDNNIKTKEDILAISRNRKKSDDERYKKMYDIDVNDMGQYDLVLDTTNLDKNEVYQAIKKAVKKFIDRQ